MCRHYAFQVSPQAGSGPVCEIGIKIRELVGGHRLGWMARMPCVQTSLSKNVVPCERAEMLSQDEILEELLRERKKEQEG
jgi:hypothetical protein